MREAGAGCLFGPPLTLVIAPIEIFRFATVFRRASAEYKRVTGHWFAWELLPEMLGGRAVFYGDKGEMSRSIANFVIVGTIFAYIVKVLLEGLFL